MVTDGLLGDKVKKGFYKKEVIDGKKTTLCFDPVTKTYISKKADEVPSIEAANGSDNKYAYMTVDRDSQGRLYYRYRKNSDDAPEVGKNKQSDIIFAPSDILHELRENEFFYTA